uniref:Putative F21O3.2 protein n=1 Tax=Davidia involucrata TaxID=16924 RepID=A0A5B7AH65_DAVIN
MDCCLSYNNSSVLQSLPPTVKTVKSSSQGFHRLLSTHKLPVPSFNSTFHFSGDRRFGRPISLSGRSNRRALIAVASAEASHCEFSSLNTPLEPKSLAGKFLSGVLQNDREYFHVAVAKQLVQLAAHRDEAVARMNLTFGSSEACLHRRIAELKENECQAAVEDVIYMLIFYKFSDIRVHLVPRLSRCIYNGRLEIWPARDWELESIHSFEVLEMIREYLTTVVGWKANSNVTENWATTAVRRIHLCRVYAASILYGYFLKSATLRHHLDLSLSEVNYDLGISSGSDTHLPLSELCSCGLKNIAFGRTSSVRSTSVGQESCSQGKTREKLRCYVMGFDPETLQMCAKPKSKEAADLVEKHICALFGDEKTGLLETDEVISTSLSSLKRMVLEAVAFGSFLWDAEEYVDSVYKLNEN